MPDEKRPYRKQRRAELEAETRRRITASTVELHGTVGPARTSIKAVAEHAGVRRSTVYRHFHDEASLFEACTAHWTALHPPPDLAVWEGINDPELRLRRGLEELYTYYRRTERMMENLYRDEVTVPTVERLFGRFRDYLQAARRTLLSGRRSRGRARARATTAVGHAVSFPTWHSLAREEGMEDAQAADLMCRLVTAAER